jgi:hypothetical protein
MPSTSIGSGASQGISGSFGGGQNTNIYTRSTKHTPSYKWVGCHVSKQQKLEEKGLKHR